MKPKIKRTDTIPCPGYGQLNVITVFGCTVSAKTLLWLLAHIRSHAPEGVTKISVAFCRSTAKTRVPNLISLWALRVGTRQMKLCWWVFCFRECVQHFPPQWVHNGGLERKGFTARTLLWVWSGSWDPGQTKRIYFFPLATSQTPQ